MNHDMIDSNGNNNYNYDLPPIRKVGPAVLPKPKNIKIQAGRATINFSSDGTSSRPTITITTTRNPNSPNSPNQNKSSNSFTYNIPIQHVSQQSLHQQQQQQPSLAMLNNNNFIISAQPQQQHLYSIQDNTNNDLNLVNNNTNSNTTYTIPVNMKLTSNSNSATNLNNRNNQFNINVTSGNLLSKQQQQLDQPTSPFQTNIKNSNNKIEDEVDLLKDLLMKNLHANTSSSSSAVMNDFYGMCTKCNEKIVGAENGLRAMDSLFHVNCFNCISCGFSLQGMHFFALDNKSYCENCYYRLLEKCSNCTKPIMDRILRATGKPFHPECFNCILCRKNLDGVPFTVDASNKIHCIDCFHDKYAPRCSVCHQAITPEPGQEETVRIVAMDKSFHVNCYKCEDCGVSLSSNLETVGGCFPLEDHIYCKSCNIQRVRLLTNSQSIYNPYIKLPSASQSNLIQPRSTDL